MTPSGSTNRWNKPPSLRLGHKDVKPLIRPRSAIGVRSTAGTGEGFQARPFVSKELSKLERYGNETPGPGRYGGLIYEVGNREYEERMKMRQQELSRRWTRDGNTRPQSASIIRKTRRGMEKCKNKRPKSAAHASKKQSEKLDALREMYCRRPSVEKRLQAIPQVDMKTALERAQALTSRAPMRTLKIQKSQKRQRRRRPKSAMPMQRSSSTPKVYSAFMRTVSSNENLKTPTRVKKHARPTTAPVSRRPYESPASQNVKHSKPKLTRVSQKRDVKPVFYNTSAPISAEDIYDKFVVKVPATKRRSDPNRANYMTGSPIKILPGVSPSKRSLMRVRAKLRAARKFAEAGKTHKLKRLSKIALATSIEAPNTPDDSKVEDFENDYLQDDFEVIGAPVDASPIKQQSKQKSTIEDLKTTMLPAG